MLFLLVKYRHTSWASVEILSTPSHPLVDAVTPPPLPAATPPVDAANSPVGAATGGICIWKKLIFKKRGSLRFCSRLRNFQFYHIRKDHWNTCSKNMHWKRPNLTFWLSVFQFQKSEIFMFRISQNSEIFAQNCDRFRTSCGTFVSSKSFLNSLSPAGDFAVFLSLVAQWTKSVMFEAIAAVPSTASSPDFHHLKWSGSDLIWFNNIFPFRRT